MERVGGMIHRILFLHLCLLFLIKYSNGEREQHSTHVRSLCTASERSSLLKLRAGFVDTTGRLSSWTGEDCCRWRGVRCNNNTGHVVGLDLRCPPHIVVGGQNMYLEHSPACLQGEIHPSLADLKHLRHLDLSWNDLNGSSNINGIPEFISSFTRLKYLNLSNSRLSGRIPPLLGNLSDLQTLDIRGNDGLFTEQVEWMSGLTSLHYLDMSGTDLSKATPAFDWMHAVNILPASLSTLRLEGCGIEAVPSLHEIPRLNHSSSLATLDLSENHINSTFPLWLSNFSRLEDFSMRIPELHGPIPESFIRDFCSLREIDLSGTKLEGDIAALLGTPSKCTKQHNLEVVKFDQTQVWGDLSSSALGLYRNIKALTLSFTNITGTVPDSIGQLLQLAELDLSNCNLTGVVSKSHLANLTRLEILKLPGNNKLTVDIGGDWAAPFQLSELDLSGCNLRSPFPSWLRNQLHLTVLHLSNAGISATMPTSMWNSNFSYHIEDLYLDNNQITGTFPESINFPRLTTLKLSFNHFEGRLPSISSPTLQFVYLDNNLFSGPIPQNIGDALSVVRVISIAHNSLTGNIPSSICKKNSSRKLDPSNNYLPAGTSSLSKLDLSSNHLSGIIPDCWENTALEIMNLRNNNLWGRFPDSVCSQSGLWSLHLNNNNLSGQFPQSLKNCTSLHILDLARNEFSGMIPGWIGRELASLRLLSLRSNMFQGGIPEELSELPSLRILDLAGNELSGNIPKAFQNFSSMKVMENSDSDSDSIWYYYLTVMYEYTENVSVITKGREYDYYKNLAWVTSIDLSNNHLTGTIPEEITELHVLQSLNLSNNYLSGAIPKKINGLRRIESLDLSRNQLSGSIPSGLSALSFLAHLNLSYNNLQGQIPSGNQLQALDDPSIYEGNTNLCGPPLIRRCGDSGANQDRPLHDTDGGSEHEILPFISSMALGFVGGFWIVCGSLLLKRSWRVSYYGFMDRVYDYLYVGILTKVARLKLKLSKKRQSYEVTDSTTT